MRGPLVADEPVQIGRVVADQTSQYARARTVLALSGFVMLGFVALHLAGNLLAFAGSGTFNAYARSLRQVGAPFLGEGMLLWVARVGHARALSGGPPLHHARAEQ